MTKQKVIHKRTPENKKGKKLIVKQSKPKRIQLERESKEKETTSKPDIKTAAKTYIDNLDSKENVAYLIAQDHLGSSFSVERSIGFKKYYSSL